MTTVTPVSGFLPIRRDASDRSEMVSQLLYGEWAEVTETSSSWFLIRTLYDGYTGWVDRHAVISGTPSSDKDNAIVLAPSVVATDQNSGEKIHLPAGAVLNNYTDNRFSHCGHSFTLDTPDAALIPDPENIKHEGISRLLSIPYLWGGRSGFGFDCSGLTQFICRLRGISIPRDSGMQSLVGTTINFVNEAKPGDLLFFDNEEGAIVHTGLVLEPGIILHASGRVRKDRFDHQGIFNRERKEYSHKLRVIKRI